MKRTLAGLLLAGGAIMFPGVAGAGMAEREMKALEALAAKGSPRAQYELAVKFEDADGVRRDTRRALYFYCKAARQNHAGAAFRAGKLLTSGKGVAPDEDLGRAWLRKAAALGSDDARRMVGKASAEGKAPDRCEPPQTRYASGVIARPPAEIRAIVQKLAPTYGLDPELVLAVIAVESGFRADVVSNKNAMGIMQLIPETAERFGVRNVFDAEDNIRGGMKYLRWLLAHFEGDVTLALAGYNAGEGAVVQYRGVPPYRETQDYVVKIGSVYKFKRHPFDQSVARAAGLPKAREVVAELSYTSAGAKTVPSSSVRKATAGD